MGTLKVDEIRSTSAHDDANAITLSGNNATLTSNVVFPTGHVLQVVTGNRKIATTTQTTTPVETNLEASITPSSTSNKIQVFVTGMWGLSGHNLMKFYLYRGGSNIITGTNGDAWSILQHQIESQSSSWANGFGTSLALSYIDSPSSTSSLLYELYFACDNASPTLYFNRRPQSDNPGYSQITLMEIVA